MIEDATVASAPENEVPVEEYVYSEENYQEEAEQWEQDANEIVFDDTGEGVGIEGDLDMEDD